MLYFEILRWTGHKIVSKKCWNVDIIEWKKDEYYDDPEQKNNVRMAEKGADHENFVAKTATIKIQLQLK